MLAHSSGDMVQVHHYKKEEQRAWLEVEETGVWGWLAAHILAERKTDQTGSRKTSKPVKPQSLMISNVLLHSSSKAQPSKGPQECHQLGTKGACGGHFSAQEVTARIWTLGERHCRSQTWFWRRWRSWIYRRSEAEAAGPLGFKKKMRYSCDSKVRVHGQPPSCSSGSPSLEWETWRYPYDPQLFSWDKEVGEHESTIFKGYVGIFQMDLILFLCVVIALQNIRPFLRILPRKAVSLIRLT